ncbi:TPA: ATP-binding protein [Escherichia coli]|uniref:AAA family ATPase n=2 Tax=Escherichia coli TaxID=562 RepID=UPI000BE9A4F5|nr:ATP-binding protein [Escherichia coli]EEX2512944.1 ATP-binding protein [Escherichia coli]EIT7466187.1 ATP-binding protein [Escherichia coli]ELF2648467.1 ATP-binding protein [Escherichia coli]ELK9737039.1 ATP-binding protein [Escherichia coli]MCX0194868.1 ATP-binding protein [Escherichia coli]
MLTSINEIHAPIPYTNKTANLFLEGKNLIITGGNGCGKTSFIRSIYDFLKSKIDTPNDHNINNLYSTLESYKYQLNSDGRDGFNYDFYSEEIKKIELKIEQLKAIRIETKEKEGEIRSLLRFHKALREASITSPVAVPRLSALIKEKSHFSNEVDGDDFFENYLVSLKTAQSYAISFDNDHNKAQRIQEWFDKIETDMQELFEDKNLLLTFDSNEGKFYLNQDGKDKFTFQTLSSGYSSILRIYADLIMRVEMWELTPDSIEGIVFIDEIDAHLHVSLQKQILRFFSHAFPKVQFIVTTHSPFVVTSVTNAIIYDLSTNTQISDVSSYSYGIILQELFGVSPISKVLSDKLEQLQDIIDNINNNNIETANNIIQSLAPLDESMDINASAFIDYAKMQVLKYKKANSQEK